MKQISFDSKIIIKLNEDGKTLYHLSVLNNEIADNMLQTDDSLIATLEEVINLLSDSYSEFISIDDSISSDKIYFIEEKKQMLLDSNVIVHLSDFGKQLYYLYIMDEKCLPNGITKDDRLVLSMRQLIKIFGGKLDAMPFRKEEIIINEQDLIDTNELEMYTKNR